MSKAVLVVDMPSSCSRCIIFNDSQLLCCGSKVSHKESQIMRPSTCPLIQAPARKEERVKLDGFSWELESIMNAESRGYNKCLEDLLGEEDGTN